MSQNSFEAKVKRFHQQALENLTTVYRASAQELGDEVTKSRGKGGNMRVDTGFLRASFIANLSEMPKINPKARPPKDAAKGSFAPNNAAVNLVIAGAKLEDTINMGFTASYARPREYHDGFVRLAAQNWSKIVADNAIKVK